MSRTAAFTGLVILVAVTNLAFAQPDINPGGVTSAGGTNGVLYDSEQVTISGSGFGAKAHPGPLVWEDFEAGRNGNELAGWTMLGVGGSNPVNPTYSNAVVRTGESLLSGMMHTPGEQYDCAAYRQGLGRIHQAYASYHFYIDRVSGPASWNIKMLRLLPGYPNFKTGEPSISVTLGLDAFGNYSQPGSSRWWWGVPWNERQWYRHEYYLRAPEPVGSATGEATLWIDTNLFKRWDNEPVMEAGASNDGNYFYIDTVVLPFFAANNSDSDSFDGPNEYRIYYDDVYVDDTLARVEVGNASTWSACTERAIQIPTAWSDNSITVTVNQGSLGYGNAWLYVIDEEGNPSSGEQITFAPSAKRLAMVIDRWHSGEITDADLHRAVYWYMNGTAYQGDPVADGVLGREEIGNVIAILGQD